MLLVQLSVLLDEHLVERQALGAHIPLADRGEDRASRLREVRAIVELARSEVGTEFAHRLSDLVFGEMEEAEGLESGRVDDGSVLVEAVEAREGRRVGSRIPRGRE